MEVTVEVSMYPLTEDYEVPIIEFIEAFKEHGDIEVVVNGLSTQLFGEYRVVMDLVEKQMKAVFDDRKAVFVLKVAGGRKHANDLPDRLK